MRTWENWFTHRHRVTRRLGLYRVDEAVAPKGRTILAIAVSGLILARLQPDRSYRLADARRTNADEGWSFTGPLPERRSYDRHSLSEDELGYAMRLARRTLAMQLRADRRVVYEGIE